MCVSACVHEVDVVGNCMVSVVASLSVLFFGRYVDPYNENKQIVRFVNCVIGDHDGLEDFVLQGSSLGMESHVYDPRRAAYEAKRGTDTGSQLIVKVQSMTVPTFANKYKIPVNFGILSIDAEGFGDRVSKIYHHHHHRKAYLYSAIPRQAQSAVHTDANNIRRNIEMLHNSMLGK